MYNDEMSGDEMSRIMKRFGEVGKKYQAQKQRQERVMADLMRAQAIEQRLAEEQADYRAALQRDMLIQHEKQVEARKEKERRQKKSKPVREDTAVDKLAEWLATADAPRAVALGMQAIADSKLNLAADLMRAGNGVMGNGFKTGYENVIEPKNKFERGVYEATKTAYDTLIEASVAGLAATSKTVTAAAAASNKLVRGAAKGAQYLLYPGAYSAQVGAAEGALAATSLLDLKKPDEDASLGKKALSAAANLGVGLAGAIVGGGVGAGVGHVVNRQVIKRGKNELARQLKTQEYADINAGRISRRALMEVNDIRLKEGVEMARDNTLWIPRKQVEHIYERRVNGNKKGYEEVVDSFDRLMHSQNLRVAKGKKAQNQEIANVRGDDRSADVMYISVFKEEPKGALSKYLKAEKQFTGVVTTMKKSPKRLGK